MSTDKRDEATRSPASSLNAGARGAGDTVRSTARVAKVEARGSKETWQEVAHEGNDAVQQAADDLRQQTGEAYRQTSDRAHEQYEHGVRQVDRALSRSVEQMRRARGGVERFVSENPVMVGVVGLAAGLIIGALLPRTRREDRAFGRWSDEVRDKGMRYARGATQRGRECVEEAFSSSDPRPASHDSERQTPDEDPAHRRGAHPEDRDH